MARVAVALLASLLGALGIDPCTKSDDDGPPPIYEASMTVEVGGRSYDVPCGQFQFGSGPKLLIFTGVAEGCAWPEENPRFDLSVGLSNYLASEGFPTGTYDLASPTNDKIIVGFIVSSQAEVPVGQQGAFWGFSTSQNDRGYASNSEVLPHTPGTKGTMTVVQYLADPNTFTNDVDITLDDVIIPATGPVGEYGTEVHIKRARFFAKRPR